jgi:hypothetical protein
MAGSRLHPADRLSGASRDGGFHVVSVPVLRFLVARRYVIAKVEYLGSKLDAQCVGFAQVWVDAHTVVGRHHPPRRQNFVWSQKLIARSK